MFSFLPYMFAFHDLDVCFSSLKIWYSYLLFLPCSFVVIWNNMISLLFQPNISLVIWTALLWMQSISDWVEYCLMLQDFLIKFQYHPNFIRNIRYCLVLHTGVFKNLLRIFFSRPSSSIPTLSLANGMWFRPSRPS